ncbi:tetratricopeptide repeat protein [Aquimarina sp. Aq107]|uniref:tetratricopeptide repeat protein n=1 Tax=Aquimarina sp. Aq107 TaxID=1191912 RepID=UPI00131EECAE|nr:tetratricopeptide repeat protein [Aquimarina sp. Aq107]
MRIYTLLLMVLISQLVSGQDIQEVLKNDICDCLGQLFKSGKANKENNSVLEECLSKKINSYTTEFREILIKERFAQKNDKTFASQYKINPENLNAFIAGHQDYFVTECQPYYWYVSAKRAKKLINIRYTVDEKYLNSISKKIRKGKHEKEHLYQRALIYMSQGKFEKAKADFYTYQEDNPEDDKITYHLAWACELNGEYGIAKAWYEQMIKKNNHFDAILGHSIVNRRIRDNARMDSLATYLAYLRMNKSTNKIKNGEILADKKSIEYPKPKSCKNLTNNEEVKKCFSTYFKNFVDTNFDYNVMEYANLPLGVHRILSRFKVSKTGRIIDVFVQHDNPYIVNEITRILYSIPILEPGKADGEPVDVKYSFPLTLQSSE